jgi:hypothetical protein
LNSVHLLVLFTRHYGIVLSGYYLLSDMTYFESVSVWLYKDT